MDRMLIKLFLFFIPPSHKVVFTRNRIVSERFSDPQA